MTELASPKPVTASGDPQFAELFETIAAKLQADEPVDIEAYVREHPQFAERLRLLLPTVGVLAAVGRTGSACALNGHSREAPELGVLGDFRLIREVGRGGMGLVYEAEQLSLKRRVALKVLPFAAALDARNLQRFQNEARAAACLHHTNIVPVFGVGCERNVHYYAMQFIDGQPLSAAIGELRRQRRLAGSGGMPEASYQEQSTIARSAASDPGIDGPADTPLPLPGVLSTKLLATGPGYFQAVARLGEQAALALDYAHQRGIVHRDVKPANLLLDADGTLWVADFGLAQVKSDTPLTLTGDVIGTLRYMSPEQALGQRRVIDQRTDVYSLGATLYELLTLRPVFDGRDRQELLRQIAFEDPRPPRRLNHSIPADLETLVLKALEKNPAERYATAQQLADDLRRFLLHEPIRAKKPTWVQHASKWSHRHPAVVRFSVLILVLLTAGSCLSTWLVWQERTRTGLALAAEKSERNRADEEKRIAQERDRETKAVLEFVESKIFAAARPEGQLGGLGREVKLRLALEAALPFVAKSFANEPLIEARLRRTLGLSFTYLGDENIAAQQFLAARTLYTKHRGPDHADTLASMNNLANSYDVLGRHADALKLRQETLALRREKLGPDHADTIASMNNLANSYATLGQHTEALRLRETTLALQSGKLAPDDPAILRSMNNLAISYTALGRHSEAGKLLEETLALHKAKFGPGHLRTLPCMHNLAQSYHAGGRHADALRLYEETLALGIAKLGPAHPNTLLLMNSLAWFLSTAPDARFRDPARAAELAAKAVQLSPDNAEYLGTLGSARYRTGNWAQAALDLEKAIGQRGPDDSRNANESFFLAMTRWQQGDKSAARRCFDMGVAWMDKGNASDDEVRRFRAEAAELLGIKDEARRSDQETPR